MAFLADADHPEGTPGGLLLVLQRSRMAPDVWQAEVKAFFAGPRGVRPALYGAVDRAPAWSVKSWPRLLSWWAERSGEARVDVTAPDDALRLLLRGRTWSLRLTAEDLTAAPPRADPEGTHRYAAGRGSLRFNGKEMGGVVLVETSDPRSPAPAWVDYGDFTFALLRDARRAWLVKHSAGVAGFSDAVGWSPDGTVRRTAGLTVAHAPDGTARLDAPDLGLALAARPEGEHRAEGRAPGGGKVGYRLGRVRGEGWGGGGGGGGVGGAGGGGGGRVGGGVARLVPGP